LQEINYKNFQFDTIIVYVNIVW